MTPPRCVRIGEWTCYASSGDLLPSIFRFRQLSKLYRWFKSATSDHRTCSEIATTSKVIAAADAFYPARSLLRPPWPFNNIAHPADHLAATDHSTQTVDTMSRRHLNESGQAILI